MFEPADPLFIGGCNDPRHYPPNMMVFMQAGWWVCPTCGHRTWIPGPPMCIEPGTPDKLKNIRLCYN